MVAEEAPERVLPAEEAPERVLAAPLRRCAPAHTQLLRANVCLSHRRDVLQSPACFISFLCAPVNTGVWFCLVSCSRVNESASVCVFVLLGLTLEKRSHTVPC